MLVVSAAPVHLPGRLGLVEHPHWLPPSHPRLGFPVLLVLQDASHGEGFPFYKHPPPPKQPNTSDQVTVMLAVWSWCKISVHRERFSFIRLQVIQQFRGRCSSKFWLLHVNGTKPNPAAPWRRNWEATTSNTHILYIFHGTGLYLVSLPLFPAFPFTCTPTHKYMQSKMTCRLWAVRRRITWSSSWGYETNLTGAGWESDSMGRGGGGRGRGSQLKTEGLRRLTVLSLRYPQTTSISSLFSSFLWTTANRQGNRYIITPS